MLEVCARGVFGQKKGSIWYTSLRRAPNLASLGGRSHLLAQRPSRLLPSQCIFLSSALVKALVTRKIWLHLKIVYD